jgi:hypothetical protein
MHFLVLGTEGLIMKIPMVTMSNYYKGLLVLSRRDRIIDVRERAFLIKVGKLLDFDRRFCEATIDELLLNSHISRSPIVFSNEAVMESFIRDALRLASADGCIHASELRWLQATAHANGKSDQWLDIIIQESPADPAAPLEIQKYI